MNLSPTVRWLLGGLAAGITTFGGLIAADQVLAASLPPWVGILLSVPWSVLAFLLIPPQAGGTQVGLANPSITTPPAVDVAPPGNVGQFNPVTAIAIAVIAIAVILAIALL